MSSIVALFFGSSSSILLMIYLLSLGNSLSSRHGPLIVSGLAFAETSFSVAVDAGFGVALTPSEPAAMELARGSAPFDEKAVLGVPGEGGATKSL